MHEARRRVVTPVGVIVSLVAIGLAILGAPREVRAQTPTSTPPPAATRTTPARPTPSDAQVLAVEQQLLCPLCVNERLDVCTLAICSDMKQLIRERLAAGSTPDDIILFFETRYGPKVRADLPKQGFNLVLFGWVGGAIGLTAVAAGYALYSMRRDSDRRLARAASTSSATTASPTEPADDRWVDALVDEAHKDSEPPRGTR